MAFDRRAIPHAARESHWTAPDGQAIRRIDWPTPKVQRGSLLFFPGRGDAYEKYLETLQHWSERGWRVTAADWRGQAGSGRLGADPVTGHIADFAHWIADLGHFWRDWSRESSGARVLAGHSMGGHLVLRAVAQGAVDPDALILSAPMLGFLPDALPASIQHLVATLMCHLGDPRRPAWKWSEKPGELPAGREALLTRDVERYADEAWWRAERPELAMGPGSWGWTRAALASIRWLSQPGILDRVKTPTLLLSASGDRLVSHRATSRVAARLPHAELVVFGHGACHELLREIDPVRERALAAIDHFLDRTCPR